MIKLRKLRSYLDTLLPSNGLSDYCPNGLQVEGKEDIKKVVTAVSASLETIEKALEEGADAIIVHHGLFWQRDSYVIEGSKKKKLAFLLENNISLFAYHLPLDLHQSLGNNWRAAQEMGWHELEPFGIYNGVAIGVKGKITPCTKEEFKSSLESYYEHQAHCAFGSNEMIQTVALISGGAHKILIDAAKEGLCAFVTGSYDEPVWNQAKEENICFYGMGHSATERVGPRALAEQIQKDLPVDCHFIDIFNPF